MPRSMKYSPESRAAMARRHAFGESPTEIAKDYGTSAAYVINVARDVQTKEAEKRLRIFEERAERRREYDRQRRLIKSAPPIAPELPPKRISLARVTIQMGKL